MPQCRGVNGEVAGPGVPSQHLQFERCPFEFIQGTGEREEGGTGVQSEDSSLEEQLANQKTVGTKKQVSEGYYICSIPPPCYSPVSSVG